tara:strand:+ start:490 stop:621 length:132 start_codon:yes stop_codon:yes gene_type:complete
MIDYLIMCLLVAVAVLALGVIYMASTPMPQPPDTTTQGAFNAS